MEDILEQKIKEYIKNNLEIKVTLKNKYEPYCDTTSAYVIVSLFLEEEEISKCESQSINIPLL